MDYVVFIKMFRRDKQSVWNPHRKDLGMTAKVLKKYSSKSVCVRFPGGAYAILRDKEYVSAEKASKELL